MNTKKVFLLSYDIYLFSGMKFELPNLVLADARTYISDTQTLIPKYESCLLIIDNRLPLLLVSKWLQRNSSQFINMNCVVIQLSESKCINRGYEEYAFINGNLLAGEVMSQLKATLLAPAHAIQTAKGSSVFNFRLTDFEEEMLYASFTKEGLQEFCKANSVTVKSLYRYRDKITARFGFSHFNEVIIFLTRNNLLNDSYSMNRNSGKHIIYDDIYDASDSSRLSMAIRNDEIIPYYQPIVNTAGDVYGVEILARWPQGHNYAISQREFIPLAEKSGLINELTSYLMNRVAQSLVASEYFTDKNLFISFNISPATLSNPVFYWECLHFMEVTQKLPIRLMIEITESQTLNITPAIKELIRSLRNRGVLFALDDFGTGYANLCHLNELELDLIKIDKTFIKSIKEAGQRIPMLESIVHLAGILELRTVAEGVEYEFQQRWLEENNIDYLQGYYFLPPVAFGDFVRYHKQLENSVKSFTDSGKKTLPSDDKKKPR
ncbi:diguanylate phosphodiesterase [Citrobacter amalonaticus]|uniref:Diguanylate phosphodiesterase n=1 Tax=Citrobacter amalonaticus TaxID=35703 RepID=A0A2S4S0R0_CITAM|nr:EAL domain-containing protein [Citrobacter amalonaticus]POT58511.1 diguanylate phosphodiesterase [Citrobacter amalonaticus]POT75964.1 diguanylate phosphodiesterase [Citrobacter amalonaticus]POU67038.1 diguanylate phosphodiesterase [Citrobacter amalonaticus]POV05199.1 diguanylate phosphodiesterase [Citrobacter amalonaticus]